MRTMACVCPLRLALSNAVSPSCRRVSEGRGRRWRRPPRRERAGGCGRRGGAARRLRRAPSPPSPTPAPRPQAPLRPPSSALCAIAHHVLEARVGPRLEQRLDAGRVAVVGRAVQRRPLVLPRRGGRRTHAGGAAAAGGRVVSEGGERGAQGAWGGGRAGRRSRCLRRRAWHPWQRGARGSRACLRKPRA